MIKIIKLMRSYPVITKIALFLAITSVVESRDPEYTIKLAREGLDVFHRRIEAIIVYDRLKTGTSESWPNPIYGFDARREPQQVLRSVQKHEKIHQDSDDASPPEEDSPQKTETTS